MSASYNWLVFTDLDGTLLDHDTYDFSPALPALERLKASGSPVIPVSSKTLAELQVYRDKLQLNGPLVAENGSVIWLPENEPLITPPGYAGIRNLLVELRKCCGFGFMGFADMSVAEVIATTGLSEDSATRAKQRLASEPILWQDDDESLQEFVEKVNNAGLKLLRGGRFLHVLGNTDKGEAIGRLITHFRSQGIKVGKTLALGDSDNDRDMLLSVDYPVIIRKKDGSHLNLRERPDAAISDLPGPAGWNQAIKSLVTA